MGAVRPVLRIVHDPPGTARRSLASRRGLTHGPCVLLADERCRHGPFRAGEPPTCGRRSGHGARAHLDAEVGGHIGRARSHGDARALSGALARRAAVPCRRCHLLPVRPRYGAGLPRSRPRALRPSRRGRRAPAGSVVDLSPTLDHVDLRALPLPVIPGGHADSQLVHRAPWFETSIRPLEEALVTMAAQRGGNALLQPEDLGHFMTSSHTSRRFEVRRPSDNSSARSAHPRCTLTGAKAGHRISCAARARKRRS